MIRTFHAQINKKTLFFCLLPSAVLAIYFFWIKVPLLALVFMVFMVFVVERLIHTMYVFTDEDRLIISQGRFSKKKILLLKDIEKVEKLKSSSLSLLRQDDVVMLTNKNGSIRLITPFPADEFCKYFNQRKKNVVSTAKKDTDE